MLRFAVLTVCFDMLCCIISLPPALSLAQTACYTCVYTRFVSIANEPTELCYFNSIEQVMLTRAVLGRQKVLGDDHPDTIAASATYAKVPCSSSQNPS